VERDVAWKLVIEKHMNVNKKGRESGKERDGMGIER
jgi:hypothetical protein